MAHICKICGEVEKNDLWGDELKNSLEKEQLCFTCNHWKRQHELDKERGEHNWAVVNGNHYVLLPHTDSGFRGFDGHMVSVKFYDGTVKKCDNLWHQGEINHPYWKEIMPDNAEIDWNP